MSQSQIPATTSRSRVFLIEGRAHPAHSPTYESCLRAGSLSQGFGDIERIECPDPYQYGKFVEVGTIRGATERVTTTLEGRFALQVKSTLAKLAIQGCPVDVQLHLGLCQNASIFNEFEKAIVFEDVLLTTYSTEDLGALASGDDAAINESVDISAARFYELLPISYAERATTIVTNEILDITICDAISCGDQCGGESDGCQNIYAISKAAGGSPGTPADIVYSIDGGATWYAHDIDSLGAAEDPDELACLGDYVIVVSNDSGSAHYVSKTELNSYTDPVWQEMATGFVAAGKPNAIDTGGNYAYIVGDGGYVYYTTDITAGVTVADAGVATGFNLLAVDMLDESFIVAVGQNGGIIYTEDGFIWSATTGSPVGVGTSINCVLVMNEYLWFVGTSAGNLYYTIDKGVTWTLKPFPGSGSGTVLAIEKSTDSELWMSHQTALTKGRILRSYNGGSSWVITPEKTGTIPTNDKVNAIAPCENDPNLIFAGGLADNGTDGYIVMGSA